MTNLSGNQAPGDLPRRFGFWTSWFVVVASMVGAGILANSGPILKSTGSPTALLLLWALGGILSLAGALTLGEMATAYPRVGGDYSYVRRAFGPALGFVYGWAMFVLGFGAPTSLIAYSTASYLFPVVGHFLPTSITEGRFVVGLASLLVAFFTLAHTRGHRESAWVQSLTTAFNLAVLAGFACLGFAFGKTEWQNFSLGKPISEWSLGSLGSGFILVMYAYTGWNGAIYLAGEVRNPSWTLPRSLFWGCLAVMLLYLGLNVIYASAIPWKAASALTQAELSRFAEVAVRSLLGEKTSQVFSLLVSLGTLAALSAYLLAGPRIAFAMAADGLFPRFALKLNPKTHVPVWATLIQGGVALLLLWSGSFESILDFAGYGLAVLSLFVILPVFILRNQKDYHPTVRIPFFPLPPLVFLLVNFAALVTALVDKPKASLLSLGSILLGFPLYYFTRLMRKR